MSFGTCHFCGDPVDPDGDVDCFIDMNDAVAQASRVIICVCVGCRSAAEEADADAIAQSTR